MVAHAQSAADIERFQRGDPGGADRGDQLEQLDRAAVIGRDIGDLRADVHGQPAQQQPRLGGDPLRDRHDFIERNAELRRLLTGLRVRMAVDRDVGIDANPDARRQLDVVGDGRERGELARRLDIDEADPGANRLLDLHRRLSHTGEDDAVGIEPGDPGAPQLAHRHDVGASPELF